MRVTVRASWKKVPRRGPPTVRARGALRRSARSSAADRACLGRVRARVRARARARVRALVRVRLGLGCAVPR